MNPPGSPSERVFIAGVVDKRNFSPGNSMTRNVLVVVGSALLSIGGVGIIVGLVWLTTGRLHGTLPYIFDARAETLLYLLPALLFMLSFIGVAFVAAAFSSPRRDARALRHLRPHSRFHA